MIPEIYPQQVDFSQCAKERNSIAYAGYARMASGNGSFVANSFAKGIKKILIIGPPGSGKSTLARKLENIFHLPVIHLDKLFWGPNWKHPNDDEWREKLKKILARDRWIAEGGINNLELRVKAAEMTIHLNLPTYLCFFRILKRYIQCLFKPRPGCPQNCPNRLRMEFVKYTLNFHKRLPFIREILEKYKKSRKIIVLNSRKEIKAFLRKIDQQSSHINT